MFGLGDYGVFGKSTSIVMKMEFWITALGLLGKPKKKKFLQCYSALYYIEIVMQRL